MKEKPGKGLTMNTPEIVVGTDGSAAGAAAVRWAAREATRRKLPLRLVHAFDWSWAGARFGDSSGLFELAEGRADVTLADAVVQAEQAAPGVEAHTRRVLGEPAPALLQAAREAALVVVGNRGHGGFASLLLGSVSQRVATHAPCPVVVVRGRHDESSGPVVVGVDGSSGAADALGLAFGSAAERGTDLVAIRAYLPPTPAWGVDVPPMVYDPRERDAAERDALDTALSPWREKYPDVRVEALVAQGSAARVLVGVSHTAQLVVVGSRGHGAFAGTLLGSVGLQLLHHADCPVVVAHRPAA